MAQVQNLESHDGAPESPPETITPENLTDFVSTLPTRDGWSEPLILYKNYWIRATSLKNIVLIQEIFKPRPDDVILTTQPKSGTTWLKALAFTISNRSRYTFDDHPLLTNNPQHVVPWIEMPGVGRDLDYIETLPSPRLLATHMPLSMFLPPIDNCSGYKVVYLCRDPRDVFVSWWHFENSIRKDFDLEIDQAFHMFCEGFSLYGPFWDHYLEFWKESKVRPNKVLFLKYEEIMSNPVQSVIRLARFLGVPFTDEEECAGVPEEVVSLCSFDMLSNLDVNKTGHAAHGIFKIEHSAFFRRGKVGDWANHISENMGKRLDDIIEEKLKGSGLTF